MFVCDKGGLGCKFACVIGGDWGVSLYVIEGIQVEREREVGGKIFFLNAYNNRDVENKEMKGKSNLTCCRY